MRKRTVILRFWATPEEAQIIRSRSCELGYKQVADFIRTQALTKKTPNMPLLVNETLCPISKLADRLIFESKNGCPTGNLIGEIKLLQDRLIKK